jgi:hypothetical protein
MEPTGCIPDGAASKFNRFRHQTGTPVWQRNYFERIIRGEREADLIREYIQLNHERWEADRDNPTNKLFDRPARSMDDYLSDLFLPQPIIHQYPP